MKKLLSIFILLAVIALLSQSADGQSAGAHNHIILLDASGSMKQRYAGGLRDWLVAPLLNSKLFAPGDRVILRTFDKRGNTNFIKDDPQRRYMGEFNREAILKVVPTASESIGRNTGIPEALEIALNDLKTFNLSGHTFIWLVTDNVQDETGSGDDPISPFYEKIYNDANFKNIYFFPLVREGEAGALVMYMLDYCKTDQQLPMTALMDETGKTIGFRPVLFRPIRLSALEMDRSSIQLESEDGNAQTAELEDGRIIVPINVGQALAGRIKFKLRSKFREWKIEQANVSNATVTIEPTDALDLGEGENLQWKLDPRSLDIGPQELSKKVYAIDLASGGRALSAQAPSFLQSFFTEPEVKVKGLVRFEVEDPKLKLAFFDDAELADRIRRVKGLEEIEQFLMPRNSSAASRNLTLEIPILVKVIEPPRPLWLLFLLAGLMLAAMTGGVIILNSRAYFRLIGPDGEKMLKLRPIANVPLSINAEQVGTLSRRFGAFTARSFPPYVLDNGGAQKRLGDQTGTFIVTNSDDGRSWSFSIEAFSQRDKSQSTGGNDIFVS